VPVKKQTNKKQTMKKFLLTLAAIAMSLGTAFAQLPAGSTAPNFTITDIDGNTHNLYDILDEGKPVLLDLFAVWCSPCWTFAETEVFDEFDALYGASGDNSVFTIAVESDASTPASSLSGGGNSVGDWTSLINYPLADDADASIATDYALGYYPTIYLICPDRSVTEIGQGPGTIYWTVETLAEEVFMNTCPQPVEGSNAVMQSYNSELISCGGDKITPVVTILNMGTVDMTACTINTIVGGATVSSTDWTGSLSTFGSEQVTLSDISPGNQSVTFEVVMSNDLVAGDNSIQVSLSTATPTHSSINVEVSTDFYPVETTWEIRNSDGTLVASASYEGGGEDDFDGGGPDADMVHNHMESLANGCYTFTAMDAYGDGQTGYSGSGNGTDGSIVVTDAEGVELINITGNWGVDQTVSFEVTHGVGIEEVLVNKLSIYPNPATNNAAIELNLVESNVVFIEVLNTLGQKIFTYTADMSAGLNKVELPVATLNAGLFYVNIKVGNELMTEKLNIIK